MQDYCYEYDEFDTCSQITQSADYLILCSNTPGSSSWQASHADGSLGAGFVRGGYLIGVFTYCMLPTWFFPPAPQAASYTSNGLNKHRCENATVFNLYASPANRNCSNALLNNAAQVLLHVPRSVCHKLWCVPAEHSCGLSGVCKLSHRSRHHL